MFGENIMQSRIVTESITQVTIALGLAGLLVGAFIGALIIAVFLHCLYDLVLRSAIQRFFVQRFFVFQLANSHRYELHDSGIMPKPAAETNPAVSGLDTLRKQMVDLSLQALAIVKRWPYSTFSLPPAQLSGQLSALFDTLIANRVAESAHPKVKEGSSSLPPGLTLDHAQLDANQLKSASDRLLDQLQIKLNTIWKLVDVYMSFSIILMVWGVENETGQIILGIGSAGSASAIGIFMMLLVPQIRPWIERLLMRR